MKAYRNFVEIGKEKFQVVTINQEEGETKTVKDERPDTIHHIEIIDRSGSMTSEINNLIDQVQKTHEKISDDDIISIIWFSSPGQFKTLIKGAKKSDKLDKLLDTIRSTLGCTCFSDPVREAKDIVSELAPLAEAVSVTLFTDGMACSNEPSHIEEQKTVDLVASFAEKIVAFNTIGYGNYYNQNFLKKLSDLTQYGSFTHSTNIEDYLSIFEKNFERISESKVEKVKIEFPIGVEGLYLNRKMSKIFASQIYLKKLDKQKNQFFLISKATGNFEFSYNGEKINTKDIVGEVNELTIKNFLYAHAHAKYYLNDRKTSLNIIGNTIGDVALIKSHMSSFTFDECAVHLKALESAMLNVSSRGSEGYNTSFLPDPDEYCVFQLISELADCAEAMYVPYHPEAKEYQRIGKKTEESESKFVWPKEMIQTPFSSLVYNESRANLSVRIAINGEVKLSSADAKIIGNKAVEATIFRMHTIIKDGALNIDKLFAVVPVKFFRNLAGKTTRKFFVVDATDFEVPDGMIKVCFNLKKLPLMNQNFNRDLTAENLFVYNNELFMNECMQKVINTYLVKYKEGETAAQKKTGLFDGMNAEQIKILEANGLNKAGFYTPPGGKTQKSNADCDSYETREFSFEFVGCGKLPKLEDVETKIKAGKALTNAEIYLDKAHKLFLCDAKNDNVDLSKSIKATKEYLERQLRFAKSHLFEQRAFLAAVKMSKLLNGETFIGFADDGKGNMVYTKQGMTLKMITKRVTEYF